MLTNIIVIKNAGKDTGKTLIVFITILL